MYLACIVLLAFPAPNMAQMPEVDLETQVKAASLANFGPFVTWPDGALGGVNDPFTIGVLGKDSVVSVLNQIAARKTIHGHKIVVKHFQAVDDYEPCNMLYIPDKPAKAEGEPATKRLASALEKVKGKPVLLVGESDGLAQRGAMLNFYLDGGNVKFEVNQEAAKAAGLQFRSQLSSLGKEVKPPAK